MALGRAAPQPALIGEAVGRVDAAAEQEAPARGIAIGAGDLERAGAGPGPQLAGQAPRHADGGDALADLGGALAARLLDQRADEAGIALDPLPHQGGEGGRHVEVGPAERRGGAGRGAQARDPQPFLARRAAEEGGQPLVHRLGGDLPDLPLGLGAVLRHVLDGGEGLVVALRPLQRAGGLDAGAGVAPPGDQPAALQLAERGAQGGAADAELAGQRHLARQHGADRVLALGDAPGQQLGHGGPTRRHGRPHPSVVRAAS